MLTTADLEQRNLAEFDAIVAGVRAYNVRTDLVANEHRALDYVQERRYLYRPVQHRRSRSAAANGPLSVGRSRWTSAPRSCPVEDAPVEFPHPGNPLLHVPNEITERDFEGWVQERGLYFASKWDPKYQPVLRSIVVTATATPTV